MLNVDVGELGDEAQGAFDVVTARSFGDLAITARFIDGLLGPGGLALISEPPVDRSALWACVLGQYQALRDQGVHEGIRRLSR